MTDSSSSMGCMGSRRSSRGIFHPSSGRGVYTQELDMMCNQETERAIELSRQSDSDEVTWAILESKRQKLDEEMIAEALAWSYEHPSPRASLADRFKLDLSNRLPPVQQGDMPPVQQGDMNECWSPTLLTSRRALLAKLGCGSNALNKAPSHNLQIAEEALRLPVGMRSACLPGERKLPCKVSSVRQARQQAGLHADTENKFLRGLFRVGTKVAKVAAVCRRNRPISGKDWTRIIGPERSHSGAASIGRGAAGIGRDLYMVDDRETLDRI